MINMGGTLATVLDKVEDEQGDRLCVSAGILSGLSCFYHSLSNRRVPLNGSIRNVNLADTFSP